MTDRTQVPDTPRRRPPGPPVEVMLWRITPKTRGRGERRELVDNVKAQGWEHLWHSRYPGPGRYRAEFRDDRRQIVKVEYFNVMPREQGGEIFRTQGRHRPSKRSIAPPVDAWDPRPPSLEMRRRAAREAARAPASPAPPPGKQEKPFQNHPPLTPPHRAPEGRHWRLRKNKQWELTPSARMEGNPNYALLQLPHGEFIYVFAPDGRWPGYEWRTLRNGLACLVPRRPNV